MADVTLTIAGHNFRVNCGDGEEAELQRLAAIVGDTAAKAQQMAAGGTDSRLLLFTALLMAEELDSLRKNAAAKPVVPDEGFAKGLENLAERAERIAALLEAR